MSWWFWNNRLYTMGPQYTYKELDQKLKQYKKKYKREWMRADYMAYWKRSRYGIELRAGWRCTSPYQGRGERILLLYQRGKIAISANIGMPYERYRLNHYFPLRHLWNVWWWRDGLFLSRKGEDADSARLILPRYHTNKDGKVSSRYIVFNRDGKLQDKFKGMRYRGYKRKMMREANRRNAPRKRGWYWTRRVRNIYRNHSKCVSSTPWKERDHSSSSDWRRYDCHAGRWESQPPQSYDCGCVTYRKAYKRKFGKSVKQILGEPNATVRAAWMQLYGIQKFFQDAGSTTIDHHGQYRLLRLETGGGSYGGEERTIVALKMTCPTTGTVYINSVPDNVRNVATALDWMYDYRGYLGNVGQQT